MNLAEKILLQKKEISSLQSRILALESKLEAVRKALEEISKGMGAYSRDPLKHCENTVNNIKGLAQEALKLLEETK